jgi:hypothetical protein
LKYCKSSWSFKFEKILVYQYFWTEGVQFYFGDGIAHDMVAASLKEKIAEKIQKAKLSLFALVERVVLITHLMMASRWYVLSLYSGSDDTVKELQDMMTGFLGTGQKASAHSRVRAHYLTRPKNKGVFI